MSEPGPDDFRHIEEMLRNAADTPDFMGTAIETIAGVHAQWYQAWITAGIPEQRAAEWAEVMIEAMFRTGS